MKQSREDSRIRKARREREAAIMRAVDLGRTTDKMIERGPVRPGVPEIMTRSGFLPLSQTEVR